MDSFAKRMRKRLEEMRSNLISKIKHGISIPEEERTDIVDFSSFEKMRQVESISSSLDVNTLKLIERAIEKIDAGTYGICENCGEPINRERLEEVPYVIYCVDCQEKLELEEKLSLESEETEFVPTRVPLDDSEVPIEEIEEEVEEVAEGKPKIVVSPKQKKKDEDVEEEIGLSADEISGEEEIEEEALVEQEEALEIEDEISGKISEEIEEEVEEVLEEEGETEEEEFEESEEEEEEKKGEKPKKRGRKAKAEKKKKKEKEKKGEEKEGKKKKSKFSVQKKKQKKTSKSKKK